MSKPLKTATGRRKTAIARVFILEGSGSITVNGRDFEEYFPTVALQNQILFPLALTNSRQTYDFKVNASGGGSTGQVGAVRLGIARALISVNPELRPVLKENGLLTRDSRAKERKKPGRPGARKRFQFSKR
ncbi:30S ribosomal protein S9 [Prosthecobacter sp.]|jgi:small subunit ribosomal protein S9|uniref:30S ribosomal protein S9 n=1 Tax=Prosthecobacter sp. TaxID=1965333 RepID=UPI001DE67AD9|nr:30S ribosomal protein S9 [Prosthecobacter sp.]MCB1276283.1 30S ribosomal protein S9 [Prosthecobacter sp.]HRH95864.1 30S ribosomal protein S9 [Prosthecobacter sp.]